MSKEFKRRDSVRYGKLGKSSRKVKWRKPKGRDNKMRLSMKSYPKSVSIGFKSPKNKSGKINGLTTKLVYNLNDLKKLDKNIAIIIAKVGIKKKLEIIKEAEKNKIKIINIGGKNEAGK